MTLTRRRSAVLVGQDGAAGWGCGPARAVPHVEQNFALGVLDAPQLGQFAWIGAPHSLQKRLVSEIPAPQLGQCMPAA
jgi:hypothetical protein